MEKFTKYLPLLITILFVSVNFGCAQNAGTSDAQSSHSSVLAPAEFKQKLASAEGAQLIDVRTPAECANGMMSESINFDIKDASFEKQLATLNKELPVFVYCQGGVRSAKAASKMKTMGFKEVYDLKGGYRAWKSAGN